MRVEEPDFPSVRLAHPYILLISLALWRIMG